jgi:hypothetical protein
VVNRVEKCVGTVYACAYIYIVRPRIVPQVVTVVCDVCRRWQYIGMTVKRNNFSKGIYVKRLVWSLNEGGVTSGDTM